MNPPRDLVLQAIDERRERLERVALDVHAHPELLYEERYAADRLARELESDGVSVERRACGVETALRARFGRAGGPTVAILAEYDALPELGHACGHNLIAAGALGAALGLAAARDSLDGEVLLLGTPAEEGGGGKIRLIEAGALDGVDAAIMFHPFDRTVLWQAALAMRRIAITFHGKSSHAAMAPWDGQSALRAVLLTFQLIDSARVHLRDGARIHGIITDGGKAANIIPERAACELQARARTAAELEEVVGHVRRAAEAAAHATETRLELDLGMRYRDMRNNQALARRFGAHLEALGVPHVENDPAAGVGSTDMGDVSYVAPSIHPYVAICDLGETTCHQRSFVERAAQPRGLSAMIAAAKAMALTAVDVLSDGKLREQVKGEFVAQGA